MEEPPFTETDSSGQRVGLGGKESSWKFCSKAQARGWPEGHKMAAESPRDGAMPRRHFWSKHSRACSWDKLTEKQKSVLEDSPESLSLIFIANSLSWPLLVPDFPLGPQICFCNSQTLALCFCSPKSSLFSDSVPLSPPGRLHTFANTPRLGLPLSSARALTFCTAAQEIFYSCSAESLY